MDRTRLAQKLVRAALAFHDKAPWRRIPGEHPVAIRVPGEPLPLFVSIMGNAGQEFGLCAYRGPDALSTFRQMVAGSNRDELIAAWDLVSVSFEPPARVPEEFVAVLREAKFAGRVAPWFMAKEAGRRVRPTRREENELLLFVLEGILAAENAGLLRPSPLPRHGTPAIWTLTLGGKATAPEVRAKFEQFDAGSPAPASGPVLLPDDLRELPKSRARWLLGAPLMPASIEGDDRALHAVLIVDAESQGILQMSPMLGIDAAQVAEVFFDACRGKNALDFHGLPGHVDFDQHGLHDALAPALAELSVTSDCKGSLPQLDEIMQEFAARREGDEGDQAVDAEVPADDDLAGWKRVDLALSRRLAELGTSRRLSKKMAKRYFGDPAELRDADRQGAVDCFIEWLVFHDRHNTRHRTLAEGLLAAKTLPPAMRHLLQSRAAALVSLHRITAVARGESVDLLDVLRGSTVRVHDRSLSETADAGLVFFARVFRAGSFWFVAMMSAPLPADTETALAWLESQGLRVTPEGLQQAPELLGRLWSLRAARERTPLQLTNTDGEPLLDVSASFGVSDAAALRATLLQRTDVHELGGDHGDLVWVAERDGRTVHLTRLEFVGGELVTSVNSEGRLARLRQWLLALPGIREQGVTRREFTAPPVDDQLPDDSVPRDLPPEALAAVRQAIREQTWRWLDEPVPALGGRTPRQAVRTAEGRRRVARMIRTMPDPMGPAGSIQDAVPRAEMLRELGLAEEAEA